MSCAALMLDTTRVYEVRHRKPHTKLQEKCLNLQKTLPELTDGQKRWMRSKNFAIGYYVARGRGGKDSAIWCQECGQMDVVGAMPHLGLDLQVIEHTCSCCGKKLEVHSWTSRNKEVTQDFLTVFVTTCEDMQVARVFDLQQSNMMGSQTEDRIVEVFDVFFDVKTGKEVIISRPYTRSFYNFYWHIHEPMKVVWRRKDYYSYYNDNRYNIDYYLVYPRMKMQPILKRNGWDNKMARMKTSPVEIWRALLTDPGIEALAKTKQYKVMEHWFKLGGRYRDKSLWLPLIKICNRRKYIIEDASIWFDNLDALDELGMDRHSPKYICPDDIYQMHDWLQMRIDRKKVKEELRKLNSQAKDWEGYYKETKGVYFPIVFDNGSIFCHVITSVAEICEEGTRMRHCVFRMGYYKKRESLILSARDRQGNRLETVEVNLDSFKVVQSRGLQNSCTSAHDEIISLVEKNMNLIRRAATRQILSK